MPIDYELALTAVALSLVSGLASYLQGRREERLKAGFVNFLTELILSITTGLTVMYIGLWQSYPPAATCAAILLLTLNGAETLANGKKAVFSAVASKFK